MKLSSLPDYRDAAKRPDPHAAEVLPTRRGDRLIASVLRVAWIGAIMFVVFVGRRAALSAHPPVLPLGVWSAVDDAGLCIEFEPGGAFRLSKGGKPIRSGYFVIADGETRVFDLRDGDGREVWLTDMDAEKQITHLQFRIVVKDDRLVVTPTADEPLEARKGGRDFPWGKKRIVFRRER